MSFTVCELLPGRPQGHAPTILRYTFYSIFVYSGRPRWFFFPSPLLNVQHINQPECDHQEEAQANHGNHWIKQWSAYQAAAHS